MVYFFYYFNIDNSIMYLGSFVVYMQLFGFYMYLGYFSLIVVCNFPSVQNYRKHQEPVVHKLKEYVFDEIIQ